MASKATLAALGILLSMTGPAALASAATLDGLVQTSAGQPVDGAMVTVFSANRMGKQTVFTNAEGRYLVVVDYGGELTKLPWNSDEERVPFVAQCNYCHQVGNPLTRGKRTVESWAKSIEKMERYVAIVTDDQVERFSEVLAAGFDGRPLDVVQTHDTSPELAHAKIEEWLVGDGMSFICLDPEGADRDRALAASAGERP